MKRNLASTATEAGSPLFLVSSHPIYKITLLERPSLRKRRETTLSQTFPRQSIAVTRYPWPCVPPSARLTLATDLLFLFFSAQHHHRAKFSRKNPERIFSKARERKRGLERSKNCPCEKIPDKNFLFATQKILAGFSLWGDSNSRPSVSQAVRITITLPTLRETRSYFRLLRCPCDTSRRIVYVY